MSYIYDYLYVLYAGILSLPLIIQICIYFILSSIALVILFFLTVAIMRYNYNRKVNREKKLFPKIDALIIKYLYASDPNIEAFEVKNEFIEKIGKLTKSKLDLVTERLIVCKNNYQVENNENILRIMYVLELDKHISDKLQFSSTKQKIKGFKELSTLAASANESDLLPFTYNRNRKIRLEARTAYMKLSKNDPFKFFDETKDDLTVWDQISLLTHLKTIENFSIPNFSKWITYSTNHSIVSFCLKMCSYFNQKESVASIVNFMNTPNHALRAQAIQTLGDLNAVETERTLQTLYTNQPQICQLEILNALGKFKTGESIPFLKHEFNHASSLELRKFAAYAILLHDNIGMGILKEMENETNDSGKLILRHIENPLIVYK
jgi:hypothetical protein